jgi:hypothetical protein
MLLCLGNEVPVTSSGYQPTRGEHLESCDHLCRSCVHVPFYAAARRQPESFDFLSWQALQTTVGCQEKDLRALECQQRPP